MSGCLGKVVTIVYDMWELKTWRHLKEPLGTSFCRSVDYL